MGDGEKLKKLLTEKGMTVVELSKRSKIAKTTLYSIISHNSNIRYDFALRIANALNIDVSEICNTDNLYITADTLPQPPETKTEKGEMKLKKHWAKYRTGDIIALFKQKELPVIDKLLSDYYVLNDKGRKELLKYLDYQLTTNKDKDREQKRKEII